MGKVKRLKLCWQLYRTSLPVRDLEKFQADGFLFDRVYSAIKKSHESYLLIVVTDCPVTGFIDKSVG